MTSQESPADVLSNLPHWSEQEIKNKLDEVLPILISSLGDEDNKAQSLQAVQALLVSCLPCLPVHSVEKKLLKHVMPAAESLFTEALEGISIILQDSASMTDQDIDFSVTSLLQVCLELLNHLDLTLVYIESQKKVKMTDIPSIPKVLLSTLLKSFKHCKESEKLSDIMFQTVNEALFTLFDKCCKAQTHFYNVMDKNVVVNCIYEDDVLLLIEVLEMLEKIAEQVVDLGLQVLACSWKGYISLIERYTEQVRNHLDVATPLRFLSSVITNHINKVVEMTSEEMQLALKVLRVAAFELKIVVRMCQCYTGYLGDCFHELLDLLLALHRYSLPCLQLQRIPNQIAINVGNHLTIGAEPLLTHLCSEVAFIQEYFKVSSSISGVCDRHLGFLLLTISVLKRLMNCDSVVRKQWIDAGTNSNLLCVIFRTLDYCHADLCSDLSFSGIPCRGKPPRTVDLYEFLLCHVAGFVILAPANQFHLIEKVLLENVLQSDVWRALLAMDIWCVVARHGSAELCFQHVCFLVDILKTLPPSFCSIQKMYLMVLVSRLFSLLLQKHQIQMVQILPPVDYMTIWQALGTKNLPDELLSRLCQDLFTSAVLSINKFFNNSASVQIYEGMLSSLTNVVAILEVNQTVSTMELIDKILDIWKYVPVMNIKTDEMSSQDFQWINNFTSLLCKVTMGLISNMDNEQLLKVLCKLYYIASNGPSCLKLDVMAILKLLATVAIEDAPNSFSVKKSIANIFIILLQDKNPIIYQEAHELFAYFAHVTKYEQIVKLAASTSIPLQNQIALYLRRRPVTPISDNSKYLNMSDYLKHQSNVKFAHKCKKSENSDENFLMQITTSTHVEKSCSDFLSAIARLQKDAELLVQFCKQDNLTEQARQELQTVIKMLKKIT